MVRTTIVIPVDKKDKAISIGSINGQTKKAEYIMVEGKNPSRNRNEGVKSAKTDFVAFINAHTVLPVDWVEKVEEFFDKHPRVSIVGGPQLNHPGEGLFAKSTGYALGSIFGTGNMRFRYNPGKLNFEADESSLTSANLACRKEVFHKVNFDEGIYPGEDPKFVADSKKAGFTVAYFPEIITYNKRRTNLKALANQMLNYGKTNPLKRSLEKIIKKPLFLTPSLFFIYLISLPLLATINSLFLIPLAAYLALDILFSTYLSVKNKSLSSAVLLLFIFPTLHLSYGLGFLLGIFKRSQ